MLLVAYLMVILIWSTTPLAIQLSQQGLDFYSAVSLRMWLAAILSMPLLWLMGKKLAIHRTAIKSYLAGSVGVYGAMMSVYWGSLYIPSGLISVIYGLSPMLSGAIAYYWLQERELNKARVLALLSGLSGLALVVVGRLGFDAESWRGILGTLVSVGCFAFSAVWVKQINAGLHPMVQTSGTLWLSSIGYIVTLPLFGIHVPDSWSLTSQLGLAYLIIFGSLLGFVLYFYVLQRLPASRVTLITLIAPVLAMGWGYWIKDEQVQPSSLAGAALLLMGLALYQWHHRTNRLLNVLVKKYTFWH